MTQWGLDTIFNPAKRHMDEEKRRLQSTREEIGDSSGGKRIDLDSGKVVIARKGKGGEAGDESADADGDTQPAASDQPDESVAKAPAAENAAADTAAGRPPVSEDEPAAPEATRGD